jgi:hypothetical protein
MQSRWLSFVEAVTNIVVGYGLAVLTQIIVFPFFGLHASLGENLAIGGIFTLLSLIRSYVLRRLFDRHRSETHAALLARRFGDL